MKYFIKKNFLVFLLAIVIVAGSFIAKTFLDSGYDINYMQFDSMTFEANINSNGDMNVKETFEVAFNKKNLHGWTRDLVTSKDSDRNNSYLETDSVKAYILDENKKPISEDDYIISTSFNGDRYPDGSGAVGCFGYSGPCEAIDYYMPNGLGNKKYFVLEYTMKSAITTYKDINDFNWRFFSPNESIKIKNVNVTITYPTMDKDNIAFYGHASNGKLNYLENDKLNFTINKMYDGDLVECHILFPRSAITSNHYFDYNNEQNLINFENDIARKDKLVYYANFYGSIGAFLIAGILILIGFVIYTKYDKEHKSTFEDEYYRELVKDYGPAVMGYLYKFRDTDANDLQAVIMDLIYKKYIEVDYSGQSTIDQNADYLLVLQDKDVTLLKEHERYVLSWLYNQVSNDHKTFRLSSLENYASSYSKAMAYTNFSNTFKTLVAKESNQYHFFETRSEVVCKSFSGVFGFFFVVFVSLTVLTILQGSKILNLSFAVLAGVNVMLASYCFHIKRRSKEGNEDFVRWEAFKRFLCDFSNIDDYSIPSIIVMEHYLVYATSFGVADLVEKQMNIKLKTQNINPETYYQGRPIFVNTYFRYRMYSTMSRVSMSSKKEIVAHRAKSVTSSVGGRGGFGGGSSFGGGGGGARAR